MQPLRGKAMVPADATVATGEACQLILRSPFGLMVLPDVKTMVPWALVFALLMFAVTVAPLPTMATGDPQLAFSVVTLPPSCSPMLLAPHLTALTAPWHLICPTFTSASILVAEPRSEKYETRIDGVHPLSRALERLNVREEKSFRPNQIDNAGVIDAQGQEPERI